MKQTIFISCGQRTEEERDLGRQICDLINSHPAFCAYFADMQSNLRGLNENILDKLGGCVGFVTVIHPRGTVSFSEGNEIIRASVWIEQEIAIAAYIQRTRKEDLRVAAYTHQSVEREGLRELLQPNPTVFKESSEVLSHLKEALKQWQPDEGSKLPSQGLERWMKESISRWADVARERISAANPMMYYLTGTWCVGYIIAEPCQLNSDELLRVLRDMPGQTRCIHPWHVPSKSQRKPYPFNGVLECWPEDGENGYSSRFWRASPELKMFYLQTYDEDDDSATSDRGAAGTQILIRDPIWRIGECALHASRLTKALGLTSGTVGFHVIWDKLRGRVLTPNLSKTPVEKYESRQDSVQSSTTIGTSDIEVRLSEFVAQLLAPLYEAFAFFSVSQQEVQREISVMLEKCG